MPQSNPFRSPEEMVGLIGRFVARADARLRPPLDDLMLGGEVIEVHDLENERCLLPMVLHEAGRLRRWATGHDFNFSYPADPEAFLGYRVSLNACPYPLSEILLYVAEVSHGLAALARDGKSLDPVVTGFLSDMRNLNERRNTP